MWWPAAPGKTNPPAYFFPNLSLLFLTPFLSHRVSNVIRLLNPDVKTCRNPPGVSAEWPVSAMGPFSWSIGAGTTLPYASSQHPHEDPTANTMLWQWWFWIFVNRARVCIPCRSIAPSWRSPFLLKGRRVGGCANRKGEHTFCAQKFCTPRARDGTHWSRESSHASTGSLSNYQKAGWVVASQEGEMEGREGKKGEEERQAEAESNPSNASYCK